jgi:hypothetical protein
MLACGGAGVLAHGLAGTFARRRALVHGRTVHWRVGTLHVGMGVGAASGIMLVPGSVGGCIPL